MVNSKLMLDCCIRVICSNLTVLIEYLDFDNLPEASEDGLGPPLAVLFSFHRLYKPRLIAKRHGMVFYITCMHVAN